MNSINLQQTETTKGSAKLKHRQVLLFKRLFDYLICFLLLPVLLILGTIIAFLVILDSPGSPFFIQERIGKNGHPFRLYKFRTMRIDHDNLQHQAFMQAYVAGRLPEEFQNIKGRDAGYKPIKKQDITRFGRFLRKTSLDEMPQIINILKGEMSLVGPRPNVPWEVEAYHDWHYERLDVLPGITGLAQVNGRSNITFDEIVKYDVKYVRNLSLKMDLHIIWRTFRFVLTTEGAG